MPIITRESRISLCAITAKNVRAVCELTVGPGQNGLVAPNAVSVAEAYVHPEAWPRALYAEQQPVGFAMLEDWSLVPEVASARHAGAPYVALWRFMIDARFQKFGFGGQALRLLISHAGTRPRVAQMLLSFVPKDNNPEGFYQRHGFVRTGEFDDGEVVMRRAL